jgi:hypothetical protein
MFLTESAGLFASLASGVLEKGDKLFLSRNSLINLGPLCVCGNRSRDSVPKASTVVMSLFRVPLLPMLASSLDNWFHISPHLFLNRSHSFPPLYAVGDSQGGHVVLDLQQGHGTRR